MHTIRPFASWVARLCLATMASGLASCYAYAEPGYAEADYVPPDIAVYPSAEYDGRVVYLVDGHWYYRNRDHWVYYRQEPSVLQSERIRIQAAPRVVVRPNAPRYNAPPAYRRENAPAYQRENAPRANPRVDRGRERDREHEERR
ncbi:MAG TPA: hypothetical protein VGI10_03825 [Polyangiaceae bacterium]